MRNELTTWVLTVGLSICLASVARSAEEVAPARQSLSLAEAIAQAVSCNKTVKAQREEVAIAEAVVRAAGGKFLPRLAVSGGYTRNEFVLRIPDTPISPKDPQIFTGYTRDYLLRGTLEWQLFTGGASSAGRAQARAAHEIAQQTLRAELLSVEYDTRRLYYGLLLAIQERSIAEKQVQLSESHYRQVASMYEHGTASKFELLQSKVNVARVKPVLINARNQVDLVATELKRLLDMPLETELVLTDTLTVTEIEINETRFVERAAERKPELIIRRLGIRVDDLGRQIALAGVYPQVSATGAYSFRSDATDDLFNERHSNWQAGVVATLPLFNGFATLARIEEARARHAQAMLSAADQIDQVTVDVKQACQNLQEALALIESQKDSVTEAKDALRIAEVSFESGEVTNLDVLYAQVGASDVERGLSAGIYQYLMAQAFLDMTIGNLISEERANEQ